MMRSVRAAGREVNIIFLAGARVLFLTPRRDGCTLSLPMTAGIMSAGPASETLPLHLNDAGPARSNPAMEAGPQPLDTLLPELGLDNHALVAASAEHLTHKEVQKGRRGRRLTARLQGKIARALSAAAGRPFAPAQLFTYEGR